MPTKHGANALRNYIATHETVMEQFYREGFVEADDTSLVSVGSGLFLMEGQLKCLGGLTCTVEKWLETVDATDTGNPWVQTFRYSYNVNVAGMHNVFRYDNADHHGHPDPHHVHRFDWRTGNQLGEPVRVGAERWPLLSEVIREASDWYWQHRDELHDR